MVALGVDNGPFVAPAPIGNFPDFILGRSRKNIQAKVFEVKYSEDRLTDTNSKLEAGKNGNKIERVWVRESACHERERELETVWKCRIQIEVF